MRLPFALRLLPALLLSALLLSPAEAERVGKSPRQASAQKKTAARGESRRPPKNLTKEERKSLRDLMKRRTSSVRNRGENFRKIAVARDYSNDYVVHRDARVTAFLDWSDPGHPRFDPKRPTGEDHLLASIPQSRRAHLLVIPNRPREHVSARLGDQIGVHDVKETLATMQAAEKLAGRLGIKNAKIYVNSENSISVGYLHVHIVGERTKPYPKPLQP